MPTSGNSKPTRTRPLTGAQLTARMMGLDARVDDLNTTVTENKAAQAATNTELDEKIAAMRSIVEAQDATLEAIRADMSLTAPQRHRKHTSLGRVIKELKDRMSALEARDPASPDYVDAVNADLAQLRQQIDELNELKTTVSDHGMRLDLLDPTVAALTDEVQELGTRTSALASALASVRGQGEPRWVAGFFIGIVAGVIAWLVARNWADLSTNYSWFTAIVVGVAVMLVVASFESQPAQVTAVSTAAASATTPAPPPAQAGNGDDPAQPATAPVPVTASAAAGTPA